MDGIGLTQVRGGDASGPTAAFAAAPTSGTGTAPRPPTEDGRLNWSLVIKEMRDVRCASEAQRPGEGLNGRCWYDRVVKAVGQEDGPVDLVDEVEGRAALPTREAVRERPVEPVQLVTLDPAGARLPARRRWRVAIMPRSVTPVVSAEGCGQSLALCMHDVCMRYPQGADIGGATLMWGPT
jgi:hypothetical protein